MSRSSLSLALVLALASFPALATAQSTLGVICIGKKGQIFVRPKCLTGETTGSPANLTQKGLTGDTGSSGPSGAPGREVSFTDRGHVSILPNFSASFTESCPSGKKVVGGGCYSSNSRLVTKKSYPVDGPPTGWQCDFISRSTSQPGTAPTVITYAVCID